MRRIWNAHGQAAKAQPLVCGLASVWPRRRGATTAGQRRTRVYALSNRPMAALCERLGPEKARHLRLFHSSAMLLHGRQGCAFCAALLQVPLRRFRGVRSRCALSIAAVEGRRSRRGHVSGMGGRASGSLACSAPRCIVDAGVVMLTADQRRGP